MLYSTNLQLIRCWDRIGLYQQVLHIIRRWFKAVWIFIKLYSHFFHCLISITAVPKVCVIEKWKLLKTILFLYFLKLQVLHLYARCHWFLLWGFQFKYKWNKITISDATTAAWVWFIAAPRMQTNQTNWKNIKFIILEVIFWTSSELPSILSHFRNPIIQHKT